jgi:hypothetical protein
MYIHIYIYIYIYIFVAPAALVAQVALMPLWLLKKREGGTIWPPLEGLSPSPLEGLPVSLLLSVA